MAWKRKAVKWGSMSCLVGVLLMLLVAALALWGAGEYTRGHPIDLSARVPQIQKYLMPDGVGLQADKLELYYDNGPVMRVSALGVRGPDGQLGVFVEQAAIRLAISPLLWLTPAPKIIEASGVTLRLVRSQDGVSIAGLALPHNDKSEGVVEWLNGLGWNRVWRRIQTVRVADLTLLLRDDVEQAEWVMEKGNMNLVRNPDEGERGTLTAVVRRLYGTSSAVPDLDNVPVLVSFGHKVKADGLTIRGRIDRANAEMVMDYFPPQFKDLLQAQGQVEVGTRLMEGNKLELPWVTLRLSDVKVQPPKGYSKPMEFTKLVLTASYLPPAEGVSGSDVLHIRDLTAQTVRGNVFELSGTVTGLQTDPMVDVRMVSDGGEVQGIFDLFPDQVRGFEKALRWLRPNIEAGEYRALTAHYAGKPSAFPGCGNACGVLDIDAKIVDGRVRFLKEISPIRAATGDFVWRGQTVSFTTPKGQVAGQGVGDLVVSLSDMFAVSPTQLRVTGKLQGDAREVMAELDRMPETKHKVPQGLTGKHVSVIDVHVPMPRGREATFADSSVVVSSTLSNVRLEGLEELRGLSFEAQKAVASLDASKTLRVAGDGMLGGNPMKVDWSMNIAPGQPKHMTLMADGVVRGEWLTVQAPVEFISMTGPVGVKLDVKENDKGAWGFAVRGDGTRSQLKADKLGYSKPSGEAFMLEARGAYVPSGSLVLDKLDVQGKKVDVKGTVRWQPDRIAASTVNLPTARIGDTDVTVSLADGKAVIAGNRLDLRGFDLFNSSKPKDPGAPVSQQPDNLVVDVNVGKVVTSQGELDKVKANLKATKGRWDVNRLNAMVDGTAKVSMQMAPLKGQPGRKRMMIAVDDLGRTLNALGIYDKIGGGRMTGEITYDAADVGGGLIRIDDFELKNPPVLVQLLNLLSLEQLLSGSSSTRFKKAGIPLRIDNGVWYLDNASLEGPSMSLRLDGYYDRNSATLNIDGKMAPAIPLNRMVGKIPLLGTLLTGSQDGVLVADFKLKGPTSDPQINVRPLSVITPGLLKDFWRGLTGNKDKPQPKVESGR